jgi:hypothetical protein
MVLGYTTVASGLGLSLSQAAPFEVAEALKVAGLLLPLGERALAGPPGRCEAAGPPPALPRRRLRRRPRWRPAEARAGDGLRQRGVRKHGDPSAIIAARPPGCDRWVVVDQAQRLSLVAGSVLTQVDLHRDPRGRPRRKRFENRGWCNAGRAQKKGRVGRTISCALHPGANGRPAA